MSDIMNLILGILSLTFDQKSGDFHFFGNQAKKGTA
jgi:hypothetical protein